VAEFGSAQIGFAQIAAGEVCSGQVALLQILPGKIRSGKIGPLAALVPLMEFLVRFQNVFQVLAIVSNGIRLPSPPKLPKKRGSHRVIMNQIESIR